AASPPRRIGNFEILEQLGEGAMGVVHRAFDNVLGRTVAIKLLRSHHTDASNRLSMLREARAQAMPHHPNVIEIYSFGVSEKGVFMVMPLVETTLRRWLRSRTRSFDQILNAFVDAGRGLAAAHAAGILHRDFKPANVLLDRYDRIYVADFGLALLAP